MPAETRRSIEQSRAIAVSEVSPFIELKDDTYSIDTEGAIKSGVKLKKLEEGTDVKDVTLTQREIKEREKRTAGLKKQEDAQKWLKKYEVSEGKYDIATAIKDGKIDDVRKAGFTKEQIRQAQVTKPEGLISKQWLSEEELNRIKAENPDLYNLFTDYYKSSTNTVDVVKYLRDNPAKPKILEDAGYSKKEIAEWQKIAINPIYLNSIYQDQVKTERNKLLKAVKPNPLIDTDAGAFYARVDGLARAKALKSFSKAEQDIINKEVFIKAEGLLIPGIETAAHWAYLSTPEKAVAVGWDVVNVATMLWGGKIIGAGAKVGIQGGSRTVSKIASGVAKMERLAAKAGEEGSKLNETLTLYARSAEKVAEKVKPISMAAEEAGGAAKTAKTLEGRMLYKGSYDPQSVLTTAKKANALKIAEATSRKADRLFLSKLDRVGSLTPKELKILEKKSGIKGLKDSISGVSKAVKEVESAWKYVDRAKFYTEPKTPAQLEANVRHQFRLNELQDAQKGLQDALKRAGSTLKPRYSSKVTELRQSQLLEKFGAYQTGGNKSPFTKDEIALLAGYERSPGGVRISKADIKATLSQEEYAQYLKLQKIKARLPKSKKREPVSLDAPEKGLVKDVKLRTDKETAKSLDDLLSDKPTTARQQEIRQELEKLSKASQEKYEAKVEADVKAARTAVAERQKIAEEVAKAKKAPMPKVEVKPALKASDLPKVKPEPTKPLPFRLEPKVKYEPKTEVIVKPDTRRDIREDTASLPDVRSESITEALSKVKIFSKLTPAEWQQVNEQVKAGIEAQAKAGTKGATQPQIKEQIKEAVKQKAAEQTRTKTQTRVQTQTRTKAITKTILNTRAPTRPPKPPLKPIPLPLPGGGMGKEPWTEKEAKSAIAWKDGFVIHALKAPYRRGVDEETFHIEKIPKGLVYLDLKGKGSQQASARVVGKLPEKLTVDVGNQDVIISRQRGNRVSLKHRRDTRGTASQLTVKRGHNASIKHGRIYKTKIAGGEIMSRRPLRTL